MRSARRKGFALSGIFMILAQVFVVAFCGLTAVAVTQEETAQNLYSNEHGSASMSYELLENDRIKWTLNLVKGAHDSPTRFMVDIAANGVAVMPENVQTNNPAIALTSGNGDGYIQAGLSEASGGSPAGSATITFETARSIDQLTVKPKMLTEVPVATTMAAATTETTDGESADDNLPPETETVNLLEGVTKTTFTIPAVEVVEEPDPVVPEEVAADTEEDAGVNEDEPVVVTESEEETAATEESSTEKDAGGTGEGKEQPTLKAAATQIAPYANVGTDTSNWTSLQVSKTWVGVPAEGEDTVSFQLMRKKKSEATDAYENYGVPKEISYDEKMIEWQLLPLYDDANKGTNDPYVYIAKEVQSGFYTVDQGETIPSVINSMQLETSCSSSQISTENPSYFIARTKDTWTIWTVDALNDDEKKAFIQNILDFGVESGNGSNPPFSKFLQEYEKDRTGGKIAFYNSLVWISGNQTNPGVLTMSVVAKEDGGINVTANFHDSNVWEQYMFGGNSTQVMQYTNTYLPQQDISITVEKNWDNDNGNKLGMREDIRLVLQQSLDGGNKWEPFKTLDISSDSNKLSETYSVPSRVKGQDAIYRLQELVRDGPDSDTYTKRSVAGYKAPEYSEPKVLPSDGVTKLTVTNTLMTTDLDFVKLRDDAANSPFEGVAFKLVGDNGYSMGESLGNLVVSDENGNVSFKGLPIGHYTLTETVPVGYKNAGPWEFDVVAVIGSGGEEKVEIQWKGNSPIDTQGRLINYLKPFTLTVNKQDDLGNSLAGATFTLTGPEGFTPQGLPAEGADPTVTFTFTDLQPGIYTLTETDAPDGYTLLADPIEIEITDTGEVIVTGAEATTVLTEGLDNNTITFSVANKKKVPLPATGGSGTMMFATLGVLALTATGWYFLQRKEQEVG